MPGPLPFRCLGTRTRAGDSSTLPPPAETAGPGSIVPEKTSRAACMSADGLLAAQLPAELEPPLPGLPQAASNTAAAASTSITARLATGWLPGPGRPAAAHDGSLSWSRHLDALRPDTVPHVAR